MFHSSLMMSLAVFREAAVELTEGPPDTAADFDLNHSQGKGSSIKMHAHDLTDAQGYATHRPG